MALRISQTKLCKVNSCTALRFTVELSQDAAWEQAVGTKGWLAFRNDKGEVEVKPPVTMLHRFGKKVKYEGCFATPKIIEALQQYVTEHHGDEITADPDWNEVRKARKVLAKRDGYVL